MAGITIISLGGSIIFPDTINVSFLKQFRQLILEQADAGRKFIIICGGGNVSKQYMRAARDILPAIDDESMDWIGISGTSINAFFVKMLFGDTAYKEVMNNPTKKIRTEKQIIVGCGWKPGCSTDKDAVLAAQTFGADTVINLTSVEYIYNKNPKEHKDAKRYESMTWKQLRELVGDKWTPKLDFPFDPEGAKLGQKLGLKLIVAKGTDIENLRNILNNKKFKGTIVQN